MFLSMYGARGRVIAKYAGHEPVLDWLSEALLGVTSNSKTGCATSRVGMPGKTGMGLVVLPDRENRGADRRGMESCGPRNGDS